MLSEIMKYYDIDGREPPPQIYDSDSLTIKSQQLSVWCVKAVEPSQAAPVQSKQLSQHPALGVSYHSDSINWTNASAEVVSSLHLE